MADHLDNYIHTFRKIWHSGKDAFMNIECRAGEAWLTLHHKLPYHPPPPPCPKRPSPSRLRRRARHARERAAAEQAVASENISTSKTADAAVQVDVQIDEPQAVQVCQIPKPHPQQHRQNSVQQVHDYFSNPSRPIDVIPQLDGNMLSPNFPESPSTTTLPMQSRCNFCQKELKTREDYRWHFETKHGREDCRILKSMQQ